MNRHRYVVVPALAGNSIASFFTSGGALPLRYRANPLPLRHGASLSSGARRLNWTAARTLANRWITDAGWTWTFIAERRPSGGWRVWVPDEKGRAWALSQ